MVCSLRVTKPPSFVSSVPDRKLRAIDPAAFKRDIIDSDLFLHPSDNVEVLFLHFHDTLRALLDRQLHLLVKHLNELLPSIYTRIINLSLSTGRFPDSWKPAVVRPLLKKAGLEPIHKKYRPMSNLQYISKLVEAVVAKQLPL